MENEAGPVRHVEIYLDGGTIELQLGPPLDGMQVRLLTPLQGTPRKLEIDGERVPPGDQRAVWVVRVLDEWYEALSDSDRSELEAQAFASVSEHFTQEELQRLDLLGVVEVARQYLYQYYLTL